MGETVRLPFELTPLEARRLTSVSAVVEAGVLRVSGDDAANVIRVSANGGSVDVMAEGALLGTYAGVTAVEVDGGAGNDQLSLGAGVEVPVTLSGGAGEDSLLALGAATLVGGEGTDAFWAGKKTAVSVMDSSAVEGKRGVNRLPDVFSAASVSSSSHGVGTVLKDPKITRQALAVASFAGDPLFGVDGPSQADVKQGQLNDCYLLASLGSVAETDPSLIYQTISDLGDGTYAVRVMHGKTAKYYQVDADLPVTYGDSPAYAGLGEGSSLWVALVEKAFAMDKGGTYAKLDTGGWMGGVYTAMGMTTKTVRASAYATIAAAIAGGEAVTVATKVKLPGDSSLVANHAYTVESVRVDERGRLTSMTIVNPWGVGGMGVGDVLTIDLVDAKGISAFALGTV